MTLRFYLVVMLAAATVCWSIFVFILFSVDPCATNLIGFFLFYSSLFLSLVGSSAIMGFVVRFAFFRQILAFRSVKEAFRQSFLFSFLVIAVLFLLSKGLFSWLNLMFLTIGLSAMEFFLISHAPRRFIAGGEDNETFNIRNTNAL